jgi:acyl-CoA synthetase (NDP forming)
MPDLGAMLSPKSVAIIGAAPQGQGLRGRILEIMRAHPYAGNIYPVSRTHREVQGLAAFPSIGDVPAPVDLAVLIIPAKFVAEELERCGRAGVKSAVIISSGFAEEPGEAGASMQNELRAVARRHGMAVMGPNSEGFANLDAALCPTFSPAVTPSATPLLPAALNNGRVAVIAQSGGMGFAFFDRGRPKEMAFNHIVTTGNEACLETFDVVEHLLDEGKTDAFLLLLEDIKTAETFRRVAAKALKAGKPIIVNKIGQSDAGRRAAASHTAALAGSYSAFQAMAHHYGLIEGGDSEEMVDIAQGFLRTGIAHLPAGRRVAICTASGGGGGWMADACIAAGLEVPTLDAESRKRIDKHLPSYGTSQNPIDGTAQAIHALGYAGMAELVLDSPSIDSVIVVMSGRAGERVVAERDRLLRVKESATKPILMWSYTLPVANTLTTLAETGYPIFTNMRNCARTLSVLADYREARDAALRVPDIRSEASTARETTAAALRKSPSVLTEAEARPLLAAYGIGSGDIFLATSADAAVAAFNTINKPVVLKVQSPAILHKTEAGAVALKLATADDVRHAYEHVLDNAKRHVPSANIHGVLVQPMAPAGREVILGINRDDTFGPLLMLGLGGIHVEVLKDVVFAPVPLTPEAASALIRRLRGAGLLDAQRGQPAADIPALADLMVRLSQFAADHADAIKEIDLNPVLVHPAGQGATVVDALIVKQTAT